LCVDTGSQSSHSKQRGNGYCYWWVHQDEWAFGNRYSDPARSEQRGNVNESANGKATAIYGVPELHLHLKDNKSGLLDKPPTYDVISESFQHKEVYCLLIRHTKTLTHELWYHGGSPSRTEIPNISSTKPRTKTRIKESSKVVSHDGQVRGFTVRCTAREYLPSTERLDPRPDRQCTKRVQENRHLGCPRVRCRREESIRSGVQCI
jgi:hypothetical protein